MEVEAKTERLQLSSRTTHETLFRTWYKPLCQYAFCIFKDMDDAEDVVQHTFCKLWDQRDEIDINTSIKSYLYRMVHNSCMNRIKQQKTHSEYNMTFVSEQGEVTENTDRHILFDELQQRIDKAIGELPPRCREVFRLSRMEQLSYAEIAERLSISKNTVETQMVNALRLLRSHLKDYLTLALLLNLF